MLPGVSMAVILERKMPVQCLFSACRKNAGWLFKRLAAYAVLGWLGVCGLSSIAVASPAAVQGHWVGDPAIGEARLIAAVTGTGDLQSVPLGLEFRLAPGWKIYWRTPGEAGLPPTLDLQTAEITPVAATINWPIPKRFNAFGFDNFGYETAVILPVDVTGHSRGETLQLRGQLEALVCSDICVPLAGDVGITVPAGPALASLDAQAIAQFAAIVPGDGSGPSIDVRAVWQAADGLHMRLAGGVAVDDVFVEGVDGVDFKKPYQKGADIIIAMDGQDIPELSGRTITATIIAGDEFSENQYVIAPMAAAVPATDNGWSIILLAVLGGMILNLMPCVLPVLAIKLSSALDSLGQGRQVIRLRFFAAAAGIITSFLLLAGILAAMRMAGAQIGWGIQFQSPVFLTAMIVLIGVFILVMLDRLVLPIPAFAERLARPDAAMPSFGRMLIGDFSTGMLATILATPCSAPFVGVAVGFALTGTIADMFWVFLALGIGLASPWLLIMAMPGLITFLPKPGRWMVWLKRGLALLLCGTAVWLMSILALVVGMALTSLIGVTIGLMIIGLMIKRPLWSRLAGLAGCGVLGVLLMLRPASDLGRGLYGDSVTAPNNLAWQVWQPDRVDVLVADGKTVLVDVTAAWCITCKANKALVLEQAPLAPELQKLVADGDLVLLQADWTRPNSAIADYLASYQRYGIPFNMVYGPAAPAGIRLGEILTASDVREALRQAMAGS